MKENEKGKEYRKEKDVYKDMTKELVPNYNILIKNGREKKRTQS
jgi:ribosome-binding protein aMBF1 (putative translation factor)